MPGRIEDGNSGSPWTGLQPGLILPGFHNYQLGQSGLLAGRAGKIGQMIGQDRGNPMKNHSKSVIKDCE
jgi:hypothetical protein